MNDSQQVIRGESVFIVNENLYRSAMIAYKTTVDAVMRTTYVYLCPVWPDALRKSLEQCQ